MEEWIALAITAAGSVGGTALGALLGLKGARDISREERAEAAQNETLRAFSTYFGALVPVVSELRQLPAVETSPAVDLLNRVDKAIRGEGAIYLAARRREQQILGGRPREMSARLGAAYIDLRLRDLPPTVRAVIEESSDYVGRLGEQRTDELIGEWPAIHARLIGANDELRRGLPHSPPLTLPMHNEAPATSKVTDDAAERAEDRLS
jgi:hypothetical protein